MKKILAFGALALGLLTYVPGGARAASGSLYTASQAAAGKIAYVKNCSACHGVDLSGVSAPPLRGAFAPFHGTQSVAQVYDYISGQMPLNNPGRLSASTYVSIMAYLLQRNGHAAGSKPLTATAAQNLSSMM